MAEVDRIDHYRLFEKIGSGGMGEVYRAVDEKLGRPVAVKLLPQADAALTRRQVRLVREAQAAGTLNHPGIVTVHDVGRHGDRSYVVMELVEGRPLRELCGQIEPAAAVALCAQAAEALASAHARGILHRDIKPDNLMVTADRRIKILDFGLAKLRSSSSDDEAAAVAAFVPTPAPADWAERDAGTESTVTASGDLAIGSRYISPSLTRPGALLGTPAYMAPEQAARNSFDERSEVYSLGLVLYELVSGRRALERENFAETIAAALDAEVAPLRLAGGGRPHRGLVRLLDRALAREPEQRFADMNEMATALRALERQLSSRVRWRRAAAGLAIAAAAGGGLTALRAARAPDGQEGAGAIVRVAGNRRLTFDAGCESAPSFTRDGQAILFSGVVDRDIEIVRLDLGDGSRRRITSMPGWDLGSAASPVGDRIAFVHFGERGRELYVIEGERTRFIGLIAGNPSWTARGELLFGDNRGRIQRLAFDREGAAAELAVLPRQMVIAELRAFPDGAVAFQARAPGPEQSLFHLGVVEPNGALRLLDPAPTAAVDAGMAVDRDGRGMYYAVRTPGGVEQLVWRDRAGGDPVALPGLPVPSSGMDTAPDGSRFILSTCRELHIGARLRSGGALQPLEPGRELTVDNLVAQDSRVFFASGRAGRPQIWQLESGRQPRVVVEEDSDQPAASNSHLAWVGRAAGRAGIFARAIDGGPTTRLTDGERDVQPAFSADGRTVYFLRVAGSAGAGRGHAVPLAGGTVRPVTPPGVAELAVSPVADQLAFIPESPKRDSLMIGPPGGPFERRELPPGTYWSPWFSRDGARVLVVRAATEVVEVPLTGGGEPRVVWSDGTSAVWHVEEAPDGDGYLAALAVFEGDLVLLDGRFR